MKLGKPPYIEIVMALDNTGSMNSASKLGVLKTAASDLVESVFVNPLAEVKVGLVPFAQYVSVGAAYGGESWISVAGNGNSFKGCVGSRSYPANVEDRNYLANPIPDVSGAACPTHCCR